MQMRQVGIRAGGSLLLAAGLGLALAGCAAERAGRPEAARPVASHGDAGADGGALQKCVLLVPLAYNDGEAVSAGTLAGITDRLFELYGGYTVAGRVSGAYRMPDGARAEDESLEIWVAVPRGRVDELRREVARFGLELRQERMYFEVAGVVELVGAER
jgi:hypothetical protein